MPTKQRDGANGTCVMPSRLFRTLVSVWLLYHLTAVVLAALSVGPTSGLVRSGWRLARPYLQATFLNHGFHYFAPDPSASRLIAWTAERSDGSVTEGRFPDRAVAPRLLYHRYFMLSENPGSLMPDAEKLVHAAYADCLCRRHEADRIHLSRVRHLLATPQHIIDGGTLTDPESYVEEPLGTFECRTPRDN